MTQVYDAKGNRLGVTVIQAGPCVVMQRKTKANDGYDAVQVGFADQKESRIGKAALGHFKKAGASAKSVLREFRMDDGEDLKAGDVVTVATLEKTGYVHVIGTTKGRGFQGVVKRHRMRGGPASHGGHSVRRPGSIGQRAKPGKINKGHRMPGHMGHVQATHRNVRVVAVRADDNAILLNGSVPGPAGAILVLQKSIKKAGKGS
jgi:large subunit ribosomal protein L3